MQKRDVNYGSNNYYPKRDYYRSSREAFGSFFPTQPRTASSRGGIIFLTLLAVAVVALLRIYG